MKRLFRHLLLGIPLLMVLFTNCELGLGEAVDTTAPTISIKYPPAASIIRGTFVLAGECDDDKHVTTVKVTVQDTGTGDVFGPFNATVDKKKWRIDLNSYDAANDAYSKTNGWEFPDGKYNIEVIAIDGAGRQSGIFSRAYDIDNTPPLFILSKPGSAKIAAPSKYGTSLKVSGTIAEDHTVRKVNLKLYDVNDCITDSNGVVTGIADGAAPKNGSDGWTETNVNTAGGTEIIFARKVKSGATDELHNKYNSIYKDTDIGDKEFICQFELSDSAKEYKNPNESSNNSEGNTTLKFFLNDDIYNAWLSEASNLDVNTVKQIVNGTVDESEVSSSVIAQVREQYVSKAHENAALTINPEANPKYQVFGFDCSDITQITSKASGGQLVTVNVTAGLNGTLVSPNSIAVYQFGPYTDVLSQTDVQKIFNSSDSDFNSYYDSQRALNKACLLGFNGNRAETDPDRQKQVNYSLEGYADSERQDNCTDDSSDSSYNYQVKLTSSIEANEYYYICCRALDIDDEPAEPVKTVYAFKGFSTDSPPVLYWMDKGETGYTNVANDQGIVVNTWTGANITSGSLTFSGKIENADGLSKVTSLTYSGTRTDETNPTATPVTYTDVEITSFNTTSGDWSFSLPAVTEAGKRYLYDITVTAKNTANLTDTRTRKFYVDTEKPVVTISSVTPYVDSTDGTETHRYLNGTFSVTGSVDETSLEEVWYEIWSNGNAAASYSKSLGAKFTISSSDIRIDTTDESVFNLGSDADNKTIDVKIFARDKAGNVGSKTIKSVNDDKDYTIRQETDKPSITGSNFCMVETVANLSPDSDFDNGKGNIFDKSTNHKLIGTVEDDDGIESIIVNVYDYEKTVCTPTNIEGFTRGTTTASFTFNRLPEAAGVYWVEIIATDVTYASGASDAVKANRQTTYGPFLVAIDNSNPKLSETEVGTEDRQYVREDDDTTPVNEASITFSGKVSDDWKLSSLEVAVTAADTLDEEQVSYATVKIELDENGVWNQYEKISETEWAVSADHSFDIDDEGVWSHVPDLRTYNQGYMTFVFTATDKAGRTSAVTRYVCKDMTVPAFGTGPSDPNDANYNEQNIAPYITTAKSKDGWYNTSTLNIAGTVKDDESGISKVEYTLGSGSSAVWSELSGTSRFSGTIPSVHNGAVIWIRATDNAGNVNTVNINGINIDTGVPSAEVKKIDGETQGIGNILSNGNDDLEIEGIAEDALSGIKQILISVGDKDFTSAGKPDVTVSSSSITPKEGSTTQYEWSCTIPKEKITQTGTVWARVEDRAGNTSELNLFSLQLDNSDPEVDFNDSIKTATVNKKITVSGTANDDQKLESIKLEYQSAASVWTEVTSDGSSPASAPYYKKVSGTYNWKLDNIDTEIAFGSSIYDCDSTEEGVQVRLKVTATDAAGNTKEAQTLITIDQNTDRPIVTFTNISDLDGMNETTYPFFNNSTLMGTLNDDDGIDSRVVFKVISNPWTTTTAPDAPTDSDWVGASAVTLSNGSWSFKTNSQGKQDIYFYVKDSKGTEFISKTNGTEPSDSYNAVYIKDDQTTFGDGAGSSTVLRLRVDTQDPEVKDLEFNLYSKKEDAYSSDWIDSVNGKIFGGNVSKFKVRVYAADANGINSVTGIMGETDETQGYASYSFNYIGTDSTNKNGIWECEGILTGGEESTGNLKDGINYFTVEVLDKANRPRSSTVQLTVDNTKPEISINLPKPDNNATVSGEVNVYGSLSEVCDVYYAISTRGDISPDDDTTPITTWKKHEDGTVVTIADIKDKVNYCTEPIKGTTTEWYLYFDGDIDASQALTHTKLLNEYLIDYGITTREALSSTLEDRFDTVVDLWLWVKAVDVAGNVTEKRQQAYLDPQGDRPTVSINYPETDGDVLGGTIKLYGEAMDNKYVDSVWVQLISQKEHLDENGNPVNWNENNDTDIIRYTETSAGNNVYTYDNVFTRFVPSKDDLDMLAENGYKVYKMSSYNPDTSVQWEKGTSTLGAGETAADYGILANFTGRTWNIKINENGEFNPDGDGENIVAVRLISKDGDKKTSIYADRLFKIDNDKPIFGSAQPFYVVKSASVDYDAEATASREYSDDMFLKDTWDLIGSVEDDVGIKTLKIKIRQGRNVTTKKLVENGSPLSGGTLFDVKVDGRIVYFKYKLETASGVGSLDFTFEAEDIAEGSAHGQTKDIRINYDNTAPVLADTIDAGYEISPSVKQTGKFYTFGSTVKENSVGSSNQSGFDYVAFYFMRRSDRTTDSKNYIYDVMLERTKTEGGTTISDYNKINLSGSSIVFEDGIYWNEKTVTRDADNLNLIKMPAADKNVHPGGLVKIGGTIYLVDSVSGVNVTLNGNIPVNYTDALFGYAMVVNNTVTEAESGELQTDGYFISPSNDDGDRMMESVKKTGSTWTWEADICSKNIPDGSIELHYVAFDKAGNYSVGIMGYVPATPAAGITGSYSAYTTPDVNTPYAVYAYTDPAFVCNNQPRIAGVIFGTDDNGDDKVTDGSLDANGKKTADEMITNYGGWYNTASPDKITGVTINGRDERGNYVTSFEIPRGLSSSEITIKGRTILKPEIVGGNNGLKYTYSVAADTTTAAYFNSSAVNLSSEDSVTDDIRSDLEINLSTQNLLTADANGRTIADGTNQLFTFKIWDETEGTEAGKTSQFATISLVANVVLKDSEKARVWFKPFWWKWNETTRAIDSSLYYERVNGKDVARGHIELERDWVKSASYINANPEDGTPVTSGINDKDPKVSGKIALRGRAEDNVRVNEIHLKVPGLTDGFTQVAARDTDTGAWESLGTLDDDGWEFVLDGEEIFSQTGNVVDFIIWWDTAKISTVVKHDVAVEVMARDKGKVSLNADGVSLNYTTTGNSAASSTQTTDDAKTPYYKVDVVPYITEVTTSLSSLKRGNASVYARTARGHYPVHASETVTLSGYNLAAGNADVEVAVSTLTTSGKYAHSIVVGTDTITSINNLNYNNSCGTYADAESDPVRSYDDNDFAYCYNRQPNGDNNNLLTDDVEFDIWQFMDAGISQSSGYITEPIMKINPKNDKISFAFNNGPGNFSMADGQNTSFTTWVANFARFTTSGFDIDEDGNTHGITVGIDTNPSSGSAGRMEYMTSVWGKSQIDTNGNYEGFNSCRFENIGAPKGTYNGVTFDSNIFIEDRFASPSLKTVKHGTNIYVLLAYYDDLNAEIRFKWGNLSNAARYRTVNWKDPNTNVTATYNEGYTFDQFGDQTVQGVTATGNNAHKVFNSNSYKGYWSSIATPSTTAKAGNYVSIDVVKGTTAESDIVVATWYDSITSKWWYSYKVNPYNDNDLSATQGTGRWKTPIELKTNAGEHCQIAVDAKGGVHIASYDGTNADLLYAYLSSYDDATPQVVTVDSYAFTGTNIRLDTAISDDGNYIVPYIGYYMSSVQKTKMACLKDVISSSDVKATREAVTVPAGVDTSDKFNGTWESTIIPSTSRYADNYAYSYVNIGVWKDADGKIKNSQTGASSYTNNSGLTKVNTGNVYGNGTANPVLGYATRVGTRGHLETAQMK